MAKVSIPAAATSGFRLIRREPTAVLLWGLAGVGFAIGSIALFGPLYLEMIGVWRAAMLSGGTAAPPAELGADAFRYQGLSWLLTFAGLILRAVLVCAVSRAVTRPAERRFGYLRLGMAEFFLLLIYVGIYLGFVLGLLIIVLAFALLTAALSLAHAPAAAIAIDAIAVIAGLAGSVYLALRLSLIAPLVVSDEKPHFIQSWRLTRGHAGSLFLLALCVFGIFVVGELLVGAVILALGAGALGSIGGLARLQDILSRPPAAILADLAPWLAGVAIIGVPLAGCAYAIMYAPWAKAWLDLTGRPGEAAA